VAGSGKLTIFGGTYAAAANFNQILAPVRIAENSTTAGQNLVTISGAVTLTNSQTFSLAAINDPPTATLVAAAADLTFGTTLDGPGAAGFTGSKTVTFTGVVGTVPLASLTTAAGIAAKITANVTTTGTQSYAGTVQLLGGVTALSTGNAIIGFGNTVTGNFALAVNTGGATTFAADVDVNSLATDFVGIVGESTNFLGGQTKTFGTQTFLDDVTAANLQTFLSTDAGGKAITFNRTLSGGGVTVTTIGDTSFNGSTNLSFLVTNGLGTTRVNGGLVQTSMSQLFFDAVLTGGTSPSVFRGSFSSNVQFNSTLGGPNAVIVETAGQTQFNGQVDVGSLVTDAAGTTRIAHGGTSKTAGLQQYFDPVVIDVGDATFQSTAGDVRFQQTLTSAFAATVNAAAISLFNAAVNVQSLVVNGPGATQVAGPTVTTTVTQLFNENVTLLGNATFTNIGNITFGGTLTGNFAAVVNTAAVTTFNGTVAVGSLSVGLDGPTIINTGSVTAVTFMTFDDPVTTTGGTTFTAQTGDVSFNRTLTNANQDVVVNSPAVSRFAAAVNVGSLTTNAGGTTQINGGSVTSSKFQNYGDPVVVGAGTNFVGNNGGGVVFASTLSGNQAVTVRTAGPTVFNGAVDLASLETDAPGVVTINGGSVRTAQTLTFRDPVMVISSTTFTGGGTVTFGQSLDQGGAASDVVVNTGATTIFQGPVGVRSLTTDTPGNTIVSGGTVSTNGTQTYNDGVTATTNTTFAGGGGIDFRSSLTSNFAIAANSPAETRFGNAVNVGSLTTDAVGTTAIATGTVNAANEINFGDAIRLDTTARIVSANSNATFQQAVNGLAGATSSLSLDAANGNVTFNGRVSLADSATLTVERAKNFTLANGLTANRLLQNVGTETATLGGAIRVFGGGLQITSRAISVPGQINSDADVVLNAQGGGVGQPDGGTLAAPTLGLFGVGAFTLDRPGNDIRNGLRTNTAGGPVRVADSNDLTVDSAGGGIVAANQDVTLRIGTNFTAVDHRAAGSGRYTTPIINLGSGTFRAEAGLGGSAAVKFDLEIVAARAILGSQANENAAADTFLVRPSTNTPITSFGSGPFSGLGDRYLPIFDGTPVLQFVYDGQNGFYQFQGRSKIDFFSIESLDQLAFSGFVVQTGEPGDSQNNTQIQYAVRLIRTQSGQVLGGGVDGSAILENRFVVTPSRVNPVSPTLAPRLAFGDVNGDGTPDLIIANGPGTAPLITVLNGNRLNADELGNLLRLDQAALEAATNPTLTAANPAVLTQFFAYEASFFGGINVAVGDFDGDGRAEIVTGADVGGGGRVRRFVLQDAQGRYPLEAVSKDDFFAYEESYRGGVRVAVGDINNDGVVDLILGAGTEGGPRVRVLSGKAHQQAGPWGNNGQNWSLLADFFAYDEGFRGGIFVDGGDYDGDGYADIVTGPGVGSSHIRVFSGRALTAPKPGDKIDIVNFFALQTGQTIDPLFQTSGPTQLVGGVAFGAPSTANGYRNILVSSGRGNNVRVEEYAGSPEGVALVTGGLRPDGNLIGDARVKGAPIDSDRLNYGATVAGFTQKLIP